MAFGNANAVSYIPHSNVPVAQALEAAQHFSGWARTSAVAACADWARHLEQSRANYRISSNVKKRAAPARHLLKGELVLIQNHP